MLVSGGQILAIDHVVKNDTLVGDGSTKPLGVNTDVIATTALVSDTSSKLQNEINEVSGKFDNYYTKNETSAASAISAALVGVIKHETEVSAADDTIDVSSEILPDGTVVYKIKASSTTNIKGVDPISAELREDGSWYITYHGTQGNIYNEGPNIDIYQVDDQLYISAAVPDVSNFLTSAVGHEGKTLVLKDNVWVSADYVTDDDIQNLSATIANTYVSASIFNTYSASVKDKLDELTDVTDVVKETSAKWDEASAFAAHSADFMLSAKLNTFEKDGSSYISGYDNIPFFDKDTLYTGSEGIKVDIDTREISISAKYLSANALDELSGKWEDTANTVSTASGSWNEVSGKQDILFLGDTLSGLGTSASPLHAKPIQIISNNHSITVSSNVLSGTSIFNIEAVNSSVKMQSAVNKTGQKLLKNTAVSLFGSSGDMVKMNLLQATQNISLQIVVGILTEDVEINEIGLVQLEGIYNTDTSMYALHDILYASTTAGVLTNTRPPKGYGVIPVGTVIKKDGINAGKVLVNPSSVPRISQLPDVDIVDPLPNQVLGIGDDGLVHNRFITFIASYGVTENAVIHEEFEKGSVVICFGGYSYSEYLPLIRRIVRTSYPDPVTYIYVFGAVYEGHVVEITCDPVDGWSVLETPVGGDYRLKGQWAVGNSYIVNDFCTFGGDLYICKSTYTSEPESDNPSIDTDHWEIFFEASLAQEIGYAASGDALGANASISLQAGSSTQWSAHGVLSYSTSKLTPEVGTSLLGCVVSQVVTGGHFIIAAYKVESGGAHSLICSTGVLEMPASAGWLNGTVALISSTNKFVPPNEPIYFVIMTDINGASVAGSSASGNLDLQPYVSAIKTNMGVLTEAPATLTFEGETPLRPFVFLRKMMESGAAHSVGMVDDEGYLIVDDADNVLVEY